MFSSTDEQEWRGAFTFVQAADTQLGFMSDPTWSKTMEPCGDGSDWSEEIDLVHQMVRCINSMTPLPRFLCVCGDLVHALPDAQWGPNNPSAARYTNELFSKKQNADFKHAMEALKVPLICCCGNHDVGDRPTPASLEKYRSLYGKDYYGFWCGGMRALVVNVQLMADGRDAVEEQAQQSRWLALELEALAEARDGSCLQPKQQPKHVIMFQHIPWFLKSQSEPDEGYFNMPLSWRDEWIPKLQAAGISKVFCGHYHRNNIAYSDDGELEIVVTSAVGRQMSAAEVIVDAPLPEPSDIKSGMRIVHVSEDNISHEYIQFDDWDT